MLAQGSERDAPEAPGTAAVVALENDRRKGNTPTCDL